KMDGEIRYGFAVGDGMLTPYGGFGLSQASRDLRFGGKLIWRNLPLEMGLEAYRQQPDAAKSNTGIRLNAEVNW
ncbi:MAG: hypothetical protein ACR2P7_08440, partial [bacterium]